MEIIYEKERNNGEMVVMWCLGLNLVLYAEFAYVPPIDGDQLGT